jgi:hypothetical protein
VDANNKGIVVGIVNHTLQRILNTHGKENVLRPFSILDSGSSIHVTQNAKRLRNFQPVNNHHAICGSGMVKIHGYGDMIIHPYNPRRTKQHSIRIRKVALCYEFPTTIISLQRLEDQGIDWKHRTGEICIGGDVIGLTRRIHGQYVIEQAENVMSSDYDQKQIYATQSRSKKSGPNTWADGILWHRRLGHIGPKALDRLAQNTLGVRIRSPKTVECEDCAVSKITQQIVHYPASTKATRPFYRIHVDWHDLGEGWDGYQGDGRIVRRCIFLTCEATGMVLAYFTTCPKEEENLPILKDAVHWLQLRHQVRVKVIRSDNELNRRKTRRWFTSQGISYEKSSPDTHEQNGTAERMGRLIMTKARAMRVSAKLPHTLWSEIVAAAVYLYNRTPRESLEWKSPYEVFHTYTMTSEGVKGPRRPLLHHLKAYGCKCYVLIKSKGDPDYPAKLDKLKPRAHIGYLVGYESTSIYRIWIPHKRKVVSARDVIFNENESFNGKAVRLTQDLMEALDEAVERVTLPSQQDISESQLQPDLLEVDNTEIDESECIEDQNAQENEEKEVGKDDLFVPYPTPESSYLTSVKSEGVRDKQGVVNFNSDYNSPVQLRHAESADFPDIEPAILHELQRQSTERFYDFEQHRIPQVWQTTFHEAKYHDRDLPQAPLGYKDIKGHRFEKEFREAMEEHIREHTEKFKSWNTVAKEEARGHQVLGCRWVYTYKLNQDGYLSRIKARLVVRGDQQKRCDLPTRATTLALNAFRILLALVGRFDLETLQLDAVNAFVHADLDETVYMKPPPGFEQPGYVLKLKKAVNGLRRSPLLWQTTFTRVLSEFGFREVPQEPCIMIKDGIICWFYVDDFVFAFRKRDQQEVKQIIKELQKRFHMKEMGELKWFLGMHIIRDRQKRSLWVSQKSYVEKIANRFIKDFSRCPDTPITTEELLPLRDDEAIICPILYQEKIGCILFAAISTRPDIAFAAAKLSQFNHQPGKKHHDAADRVLKYLYKTKELCLVFGVRIDTTFFVCASDASFADNRIDRKSSQGYIMKLFGGPVAWRANKQDTVTTSSTEAEFLAISQTAREAIFIRRLMDSLSLQLHEPLMIDCDNKQTIRLLTEQSMKLQTKLRHVDIHSHWLRQEVQRGTIQIRWQPTAVMIADGLTKSLNKEAFRRFKEMIGLENPAERVFCLIREEELRCDLVARRMETPYREDNRTDSMV